MPPPPPGSEQSPWESTTIILELKDTDGEQLDVGSNTYLDEMGKKKREFSKEIDEKFNTHGPPVSLSSKHETNGGVQQVEPGSEIIVWWDEPEDRDPENPMNWSSTKKWVNICTISVISFLV